MTEDFKKGLATGLAIGGVTVVKGGSEVELPCLTTYVRENGTQIVRTFELKTEVVQLTELCNYTTT